MLLFCGVSQKNARKAVQLYTQENPEGVVSKFKMIAKMYMQIT